VENKSRQLDTNCKSLEFSKDSEAADAKEGGRGDAGSGSGNAGSGGERQSKRPRRIRNDHVGTPTHVSGPFLSHNQEWPIFSRFFTRFPRDYQVDSPRRTRVLNWWVMTPFGVTSRIRNEESV